MPDAEPLYHTDDAGARWRVYDCAYGKPPAAPFVTKRLELGDPRATGRYFVGEDGTKRVHAFVAGEGRGHDPETLARQLRSAGYLGRREPFDASSLDPGLRPSYGPDR